MVETIQSSRTRLLPCGAQAKMPAGKMTAYDPLWPAMTGQNRRQEGRSDAIRAKSADRLDSWKEIATYLNRSVRSVRRWEQKEQLPVHRHVNVKLGRVFAFTEELDAWRKSRALAPAFVPPSGSEVGAKSRSIAILPFQTRESAENSDTYFAEGLTDEVTTALTRVGQLLVTSRRSAMVSANRAGTTKAVATELGVRYLVEGSVRWSGRRFRVSATLIDAHVDVQRWAESFEGSLEDAFLVQQEIARRIVAALELQLSPDEANHLHDLPLRSMAAYECYLHARHDMWRWNRDSIDNAVRLLHEAISLEGEHPRLYAALGVAHLQYREAGIDLTDVPLSEANKCVTRLLALDEHSASGRQLRGWLSYSRGDIQGAVRDLRVAHNLEPSNCDTLLLLANCLLISGRGALAQPLLIRVLAIDPLTPITRCMPGYAAILGGNAEAAIDPYRQMFEMDPSNPLARLFFAWALTLNRRDREVVHLMRGLPPDQRGTIPARLLSFMGMMAAGSQQEALSELTPGIDAFASGTDVFPRLLAEVFALGNLRVQAVRWLRVAIERGFINYPYLARTGNAFAQVRDDPSFLNLLELVRERWERFDA